MTQNRNKDSDILIVGAGPAGIGMAVFLKRAGVSFTIIDKESIGSTFKRWPKQMTFITPSFTTNFFGYPDLNSITPDSSPAFSLKKTFPTGSEYAKYLEAVARVENIEVKTGYQVLKIEKNRHLFQIQTNKGIINSKFVIWAAGEYHYPNDKPFEGAKYCIHNSKISDWSKLDGKDFFVIGGYESGMDSTINLIRQGKNVTVLDKKEVLITPSSDPSKTLSPKTIESLNNLPKQPEIISNAEVIKVSKKEGRYLIETKEDSFTSQTRPILATGFKSSLNLVSNLFEFNEKGNPLLTEKDESTKTKNLYLVGPQVTHGEVVLCFIYKFRQRLSVVAEDICQQLKIDSKETIKYYSQNNMHLNDLSCCNNQCDC